MSVSPYILLKIHTLIRYREQVEVYHLETRQEVPPGRASILESGPLKASLLVETQIGKSSWIKTTISLQAAVGGAGSYVEFDNEIEWLEDKKFLKVEFPVDVHNTEVSYSPPLFDFGLSPVC